ncbi:MAG: VOC family protein [Lachnospiraceae bacterium]|nr:VOC family protein [Lachnospiraceae bacterium]
MHLKNILIVVKDIELSKAFYEDLFGLNVVTDFGGNVILTEGLVLQEQTIWENFTNKKVVSYGNDAELYFEENDMDSFIEKMNHGSYEIEYVNPPMEHDWGQRVIRIYDPDGHIIEVGESLEYVAKRYLKQGVSVEEAARKTQLPLSQVEEIAKGVADGV